MFSDEIEGTDWDSLTRQIYDKTDADVRRALGKTHCDVDDFMALVSPAAEPYLETMAQLSRHYTEERFGRVMSMFIPLYITNSCTNSCVYCGFHIQNPMARVILTPEQIENEYKAIKKLAPFENILIVTGENPAKAGRLRPTGPPGPGSSSKSGHASGAPPPRNSRNRMTDWQQRG